DHVLEARGGIGVRIDLSGVVRGVGARHPLAHQHPHRGHHHDGDQERPDQHAALDVRDDHRDLGRGGRARGGEGGQGRGGHRGRDRTGGRRYAPTPWSPIRSPPTLPTVRTPGPRLLRFPRRPSVATGLPPTGWPPTGWLLTRRRVTRRRVTTEPLPTSWCCSPRSKR